MGKFDYILKELENSNTEIDVSSAFRSAFTKLFIGCELTTIYGCDTYLTYNNEVSVLCEFKNNWNLSLRINQCKALLQSIFYLKRFETYDKEIPKVVFIGDNNEYFIIHTNPLSKYLDYDIDWNTSASKSATLYPDMIQDMIQDKEIDVIVANIDDRFIWKSISYKIIEKSTKVIRLIKITDKNIVDIFDEFCVNVLLENCTLTEHQKATLFMMRIIDPNSMLMDTRFGRNGLIHTDFLGDVLVNEPKWDSFFQNYDGSQYSISEKQNLGKIADRIIENRARRKTGDFFTPIIWRDEADKLISKEFGENYKEECVVWDCAWGTGNLTRELRFKELYASSLHQGEIDIALKNRVNSNSTRFQYDFLNDGIIDNKIDITNDSKLPQGLKDSIVNKRKIIVFINPPYGTSGNMGVGENKDGISDTKIKVLMSQDKLGNCSDQLYAQFLYKLYKIKIEYDADINICFFSPPLFLTGESFKSFRKIFFDKFNFVNGFIINANEFSGVKKWGLSFSILKNEPSINRNNFNFVIKHKINGISIDMGNIILYNTDNIETLNYWVKKDNNYSKNGLVEYPQVSSPLSVKDKGLSGIMHKDGIGYMVVGSNKIGDNTSQVIISTASHTRGHGFYILKNNIYKSLILFTARKLIKSDWLNQKDEYLAPNESHKNFEQFKYDSIIYSLFNTSSNQSSMRQIDYKNKKWDIKNEFFWMSKEEMMKMSDTSDMGSFDDLYYDANDSNNRFIYNLLFGEERIYDKLSPDAKEVVDFATSLVKKTFKMRKTLHDTKPEYHLNTWDAGWYQIKLILKKFYVIDNAQFAVKYKALEDRMIPLVYELGFLK